MTDFKIKVCFLVFILLSFSSVFALTPSEQDAIIIGDVIRSRAGVSTYSTGSWLLTYARLKRLADSIGVGMDVGGLSKVAETYFLPLNMRVFFLDAWWSSHANTSTTNLGYYSVIDDWLTVSDKYGFANFFATKMFAIENGWDQDVIAWKPDTRTYNKTGSPLNFTSIDHPWILEQFKEDLKQLYEYYGDHPSWIGISTQGDWAGFAVTTGGLPNYGFSNYTLANFTKTDYYKDQMNATGYHSNGTKCKLWEMFIDKTTNYNTTELSNDMKNYGHAGNIQLGEFAGFNAYLIIQNLQLIKDMLAWFEAYTGLEWMWIGDRTWFTERARQEVGLNKIFGLDFGSVGPYPEPPTQDDPAFFMRDAWLILKRLLNNHGVNHHGLSSLGAVGDNRGGITMEEIRTWYLLNVPLLARAHYNLDWDAGDYGEMDNMTHQTYSRAFGEILSRMRYYGGWFGHEKEAINVLWIGDRHLGYIPQFLTSALNITLIGYSGLTADNNLTTFGDFSQFDVLVWGQGGPNMDDATTNLQDRIKTFVQNGGGFVVATGWGWAEWANEIIGYNYTGTSSTIGNLDINYSHPILKPYTDISEYNYYKRIIIREKVDAGAKAIVNDTDTGPLISENSYGSGRGVFVGAPYRRIEYIGNPIAYADNKYGAPRDSFLVLLTNTIFYAAKKESLLPVWWYSSYESQHAWNGYTYYSISGKPGGPILVWLTNGPNISSNYSINYGENTNFEIHLNASFYGLSNNWLILDVNTMQIIEKSNSSDIKINLTIPSLTWKPLYIINRTSDKEEIYSNMFVIDKNLTDENNISYSIKGPYMQTKWLLVNSNNKPNKISTNATGELNECLSLEQVFSGNCWFYDDTEKVVYVKFNETVS